MRDQTHITDAIQAPLHGITHHISNIEFWIIAAEKMRYSVKTVAHVNYALLYAFCSACNCVLIALRCILSSMSFLLRTGTRKIWLLMDCNWLVSTAIWSEICCIVSILLLHFVAVHNITHMCTLL